MSDTFLSAATARSRDAAPSGKPEASLPTDRGETTSSTFASKLAVGHQEIGRIVDELDQIYSSQPTEWLPMEHIGQLISNQWYEDLDEFEDAVGGTFSEFMHAMPHIEIRRNARGAEEFKLTMPDPDASPCVMTLRVESREDLWRVLFKSPDAKITISHLEFEIGADNKRVIDTLYNQISHAVWNLSCHLRGAGGDLPSEHAERIAATIDQLNQLLDVEEPFELVVLDPTGASLFKPDHGVKVMSLDGDLDDADADE